MSHASARRSARRRAGLLAALGLTALALGPVGSAQATVVANDSWTGAGTPDVSGNLNWSDAANWTNGAPANGIGLTFDSRGCTVSPMNVPSAGCSSFNNVSGLSASGLTLDDALPYQISGNALTLGGGGLSASTTATTAPNGGPTISNPVVLGADQTWTLSGTGNGTATSTTPPGGSVSLAGGLTGGHVLTANLSRGASLYLSGNASVGSVTATGANAANTGSDSAANGYLGVGGNLTTSTGPVTLSNLDVQFNVPSSGTQSTGPLTLNGDQLNIGQGGGGQNGQFAGIVASTGAVSMDANDLTNMFIDTTNTSPVAGTDYSQLTAAGNLTVGGQLALTYGGNTSAACPTTTPGTVYPIIKTTGGTLSGTFTGLADGSVTYAGTFCNNTYDPSAIAVRINYTPTAVTATVLGTSTTAVTAASPQPAQTNQPVTLTATVTQSSGTPGGTVAFFDGGFPISSCQNDQVSRTGVIGPYTATCTAAFDARDYHSGSNQPSITAEYTPAAGNNTAPSGSFDNGGQPYGLTITPQGTTTALTASSTSPAAGQAVTYTATVAPGAYLTPTVPGYSVTFYDGSTPIRCSGSSDGYLTGTSPDRATCTTTYASAGTHAITATYQGDDGNFSSSTSSPVAVTVGGGSTSTTTTTTAAPVTTTTTTTTTPAPPAAGTGTPHVSPPTVSGTAVTIPVSCAAGGASCTVTSQLTAIETLQGGKVIALAASARIIHETVLLGTATITLKAGQHMAVKVSLNGAGRRLLAAHHNLKVHLAISRTVKGGKRQTVSARTVRFHATRRHH